jgi:hypothetical protein
MRLKIEFAKLVRSSLRGGKAHTDMPCRYRRVVRGSTRVLAVMPLSQPGERVGLSRQAVCVSDRKGKRFGKFLVFNGVVPLLTEFVWQESEAESYVLRGHIAVLLGLLCVRNPQNQRVLLQSMPGASDASKLSSLIATIRDFVTFCADVVRKMTKVAEDSEESEEGAEKLVIEEPALDKDVDVANAVIEALESLRVSLL